MKIIKTISILLAGFVAVAMAFTACGNDDDEEWNPNARDLPAGIDKSLLYKPDNGGNTSNVYTELKVYVVDKDGNDLMPQLVGEYSEYSWFAEYKGGHFYNMVLGGSPSEEAAEDMINHPRPEGYLGGVCCRRDSGDKWYAELTSLRPKYGERESATFHWKDGTSNTVEFMAFQNADYPRVTYPRYYMAYFVDGKQTTYPIVLVR